MSLCGRMNKCGTSSVGDSKAPMRRACGLGGKHKLGLMLPRTCSCGRSRALWRYNSLCCLALFLQSVAFLLAQRASCYRHVACVNPRARLILLITGKAQLDQRIIRIENRTKSFLRILGCYISTWVVFASVHCTLWRTLGLDRGDCAKPEQTNARVFLCDGGENSEHVLFNVRGIDIHCLKKRKVQIHNHEMC